uniref:Uncharacterized protein n=1 Tax=Rhizophora mucronata TaxID=61149 RepID=A0A2P2PAZ7_RHIMU
MLVFESVLVHNPITFLPSWGSTLVEY